MAGDAEAGHVRARVKVESEGNLHGGSAQSGDRGQDLSLEFCEIEPAGAYRVEQHAGAERFGEDERVPGPGAGIGDDPVRVDRTVDAEAIFGLLRPRPNGHPTRQAPASAALSWPPRRISRSSPGSSCAIGNMTRFRAVIGRPPIE